MEGPITLEKLKKKLTIANVRTALNAGKFKEFVDDIRQFKKDEKIEGNLKDIVDTKTGDLPSLANKFDTLIPPSGILNPAEIDRTISALRSIKKLNKGLNTDIEFPRYRDIYPAYRDIPPSKEKPKSNIRTTCMDYVLPWPCIGPWCHPMVSALYKFPLSKDTRI